MSFGYKHHLDRHIRLIHLSERLECKPCNKQFIKKKAYNKHLAKFHSKISDKDLHENKTMTKTESIKPEDIYESDSEMSAQAQVHSEK